MDVPRKKISIVTKIFSVFLAITALDLSAIYIFTGTGQIDQIGRNGLLLAENTALRILQLLQAPGISLRADADLLGQLNSGAAAAGLQLRNCSLIGADGKSLSNPATGISPRALKAMRLYESEQRLFYADLTLADFSADIFIPLKPLKANLLVVTCNVPLESIRESFARLLRLSLIILGVTLLMQIGLGWFIYRVFIRRLRVLEKASDKIGQGDFSGDFQAGKRFDEIDHLGYRFNEMRLALAEKTRVLEDTLLDLEKVNFHLEGDLILGEEIQQSILPEKTAGKGLKWAVTYKPMSKVSGDFYDVYDLPGGATGILQFDASGHGVPAALLTMMAKISFVEAIQKKQSPNEVVAAVNDELSTHLQKTGNFLTAFYAVISPDGTMTYCNAAHTQIFLIPGRSGAIILLDPTSLSIGFAPTGTGSFHNAQVHLNKGDRLVIHTDGVTEARKSETEQFGIEGVLTILEKHRSSDLQTLHRAIIEAWEKQVDRRKVEDDVTLITVEI